MVPDGWKTIDQAAEISGYAPEVIRRWARGIRADGEHTDTGQKPGSKRAASAELLLGRAARIVRGSDIKRNFRGRIIISDHVVAAMRVWQDKIREAKAQGGMTIEEFAESEDHRRRGPGPARAGGPAGGLDETA